MRAFISRNWLIRLFMLGQAYFSHRHCEKGLRPGHWLMPNAFIKSWRERNEQRREKERMCVRETERMCVRVCMCVVCESMCVVCEFVCIYVWVCVYLCVYICASACMYQMLTRECTKKRHIILIYNFIPMYCNPYTQTSMDWDIFSCPLSPLSSSISDRRISVKRTFMRWHSYKTRWGQVR